MGRVALNSKGGNRLAQHAVDLPPPSVVDPVAIPPVKTYVFFFYTFSTSHSVASVYLITKCVLGALFVNKR